MRPQIATTKKEEQERLKDALLGRILKFGVVKCDCATCPYEKECEADNPDFDANHCKVS